MKILNYLIESKYLLWILLSIPAFKFMSDFVVPTRYYAEMMYQSGVLSVQLFVFTLSISPITQGLKKYNLFKRFRAWLLQRRRYFGVSSFVYAFIHTCLYIREIGDFYSLYEDFFSIAIGFGWVGLVIMFVPAMTSNNLAMRTYGRRWKRLQQLSYLVGIAVIVHWASLGIFLDVGYLWLSILVVAKSTHLILYFSGARKKLKKSI